MFGYATTSEKEIALDLYVPESMYWEIEGGVTIVYVDYDTVRAVVTPVDYKVDGNHSKPVKGWSAVSYNRWGEIIDELYDSDMQYDDAVCDAVRMVNGTFVC